MKKVLVLLSLAVGFMASAQQNPQYSLFMFNKQVFNPAYAGAKNVLSLNADYRWQWTGFGDGAPETFSFGAHTPIFNGATVSKSSVGIVFMHDAIGFAESNQINLQYSYRVRLFEKSTLSFGLQASGNFSTYNYDKFNNVSNTSGDDALNDGGTSEFSPNFGAGLYLSSDEYYVGVSSTELLDNSISSDERNPVRHYYAMAGYIRPINESFKLRVNALLKFVEVDAFDSPYSADFNLSGIYMDRFILGASYRTDETVSVLAQIQVTNNLNIGYVFDFNSGRYGNPGGNSHEVFLGFDLGAKNAKFTTPRFVSLF